MINIKNSLLSLILLGAFTAQASLINTSDVTISAYADDLSGGYYYTVNNQSDSAITEFGVTTGNMNGIGSMPWIDDFYPYTSDNVAVAFADVGWDYYLGDAWSASFYDKTSWDANFLGSHGSYSSLYGEADDIAGVNWFYFDQAKFDELWINANQSDFFINNGESLGDEFGSFFRFDSELTTNFAAFNLQSDVALIGTGSTNSTTSSVDVPEPSILGLFAIGFLLFLRKQRFV